MKRFGVILTWVMAAALMAAVAVTAVSDHMSLKPITFETQETDTATTAAFTVNLNTATAEDLQQLKGIGEVLAGRIIEYRETYGGFRSVEELLDVKGVGQTRLDQWRPYLVV